MIQNVAAIGLPVDETLYIRKNRLMPENVEDEKKLKRICIVTGTHGDELEGQYVCTQIIRRVEANKDALNGIIDIYPALNPLGIDSIKRGVPRFELDLNRIFPGDKNGTMAEYMAAEITEDLLGSDLCIDIHASNKFLVEMPQARISDVTAPELVPMARQLNLDFLWIHSMSTILKNTLAHTLNSRGVPTIVAEIGVGLQVTKEYSNQFVEGIFHLLHHMDVWRGEVQSVREPIISGDSRISYLNAEASGLFIPEVEHCDYVEKGQLIGNIFSSLTGEVLTEVRAEESGVLFTLRTYPMTYEGALIGRIITGTTPEMAEEHRLGGKPVILGTASEADSEVLAMLERDRRGGDR